jgi:hypothetical protein
LGCVVEGEMGWRGKHTYPNLSVSHFCPAKFKKKKKEKKKKEKKEKGN